MTANAANTAAPTAAPTGAQDPTVDQTAFKKVGTPKKGGSPKKTPDEEAANKVLKTAVAAFGRHLKQFVALTMGADKEQPSNIKKYRCFVTALRGYLEGIQSDNVGAVPDYESGFHSHSASLFKEQQKTPRVKKAKTSPNVKTPPKQKPFTVAGILGVFESASDVFKAMPDGAPGKADGEALGGSLLLFVGELKKIVDKDKPLVATHEQAISLLALMDGENDITDKGLFYKVLEVVSTSTIQYNQSSVDAALFMVGAVVRINKQPKPLAPTAAEKDAAEKAEMSKRHAKKLAAVKDKSAVDLALAKKKAADEYAELMKQLIALRAEKDAAVAALPANEAVAAPEAASEAVPEAALPVIEAEAAPEKDAADATPRRKRARADKAERTASAKKRRRAIEVAKNRPGEDDAAMDHIDI